MKPTSKAEGKAHLEIEEARRWYQLGSGTWKSVRRYYQRQRNKARRREGRALTRDAVSTHCVYNGERDDG